MVKEKKYEAFGNLVWGEGDDEDNREFTSKEKDPTGFHYFGARYYSGDIGRFLSPDPHTLYPGNINLANSQELNPYVYCRNNPMKYVDLLGLEESSLLDYWETKQQIDRYQQTRVSMGYFAVVSGDGSAVADKTAVSGPNNEQKTWGYASESIALGLGPATFEGGVYYLVDPSTWMYHWWIFVQLGGGLNLDIGIPVTGAVQIEFGTFTMNADINPANMDPSSFAVSGFLAIGPGISAQHTWSCSGGSGTTMGGAGGIGLSGTFMYTYSFYQGTGSVVPDYIKQLINK